MTDKLNELADKVVNKYNAQEALNFEVIKQLEEQRGEIYELKTWLEQLEASTNSITIALEDYKKILNNITAHLKDMATDQKSLKLKAIHAKERIQKLEQQITPTEDPWQHL